MPSRNPNIQEMADGWDAALAGSAVATCPYRPPAVEWGDWAAGYKDYCEDRLDRANSEIYVIESA